MDKAALLEMYVSKTGEELAEKLQKSGYFGVAFVVLTDGRNLSAEYVSDPIMPKVAAEIREAVDEVLQRYAQPIDLVN